LSISITFRASPSFREWLDELVENSQLKDRTQLIKKTLSEHATEVVEEVEDERLEEYQELVEIAQEDTIDKRIAQEKKKTATFHTFVASMVFNMDEKGAEKEQLLEVVESNMPIAERRGVKEKVHAIKTALENDNWKFIQRQADKHEGFNKSRPREGF
jgi:glucose-6-phosphate isomerase